MAEYIEDPFREGQLLKLIVTADATVTKAVPAPSDEVADNDSDEDEQ